MKTFVQAGADAARTLRRVRPTALTGLGAFARTRASFSRWIDTARAWQWAAVVGRVALAGLGLVLLGAIGRSALARSTPSPEQADHGAVDAGALVVAKIAGPPASAAPPAASADAVAMAVPPPPETSAPSPARGRATPDDPVYLNQATLTDLHRLPGVGPKRAEAILALRARLGHFRQIEDLLKVKGIGRSSLRKLRPLVRLDPPPSRSDAGG